jgi:radical SAM superfamily enzyme YgiQ (UPF0313 family)
MKVALVQCPVWGTREPPLAIVQLSGCLKSKGHEVNSFDLNNYMYRERKENFKNMWAWEQSMFWYNSNEVRELFAANSLFFDGYADKVLKNDPDVVGFSIAASSYNASVELSKILRKKKKEIRIIYGGTVFYDKRYIEKSFEESPVDYVISGEGDEVFPELVGLIGGGGNGRIEECQGIHYRIDREICYSGRRPLIKDLDTLPLLDFSDLKIDDYDDTRHVSILASRGCIWHCAYCSSCAFWKGYRFMSGERIHQELNFHLTGRKDVWHVDFMDLVFNGDTARTIEFSDLMIKYSPGVTWVANAVISPELTRDVLDKMRAAGCKKLIFGIESGSQNVLKLMNKRYKISDAKKVIKDTFESGIQVTTNFMFGFPGETDADFKETLTFVKEVGRYIERVYPSRTYCAMEEGSYLYSNAGAYGVKTPFNHHLYWETADGKNTYPVRLKRCQEFEKTCQDLGVNIDCGVKTSVALDEYYNLGHYYEYISDYKKASEYFSKYYEMDPSNDGINKKLKDLSMKLATGKS